LSQYIFINIIANKIYFCPHHPESGFDGEIAELKIDCECRKPKPGMILEAVKKWNIDLSFSYLIGDRWRDIQTAKNIGLSSILINYDYDEKKVEADFECVNFEEATRFILKIY
jgi:histidinol-phosphate phosphatase family protein